MEKILEKLDRSAKKKNPLDVVEFPGYDGPLTFTERKAGVKGYEKCNTFEDVKNPYED